MDRPIRRLPAVSDWARPHVDPDDVEYEEPQGQRSPSRPTLMDRAREQHRSYRDRADVYRKACRENFLVGIVLLLLTWLPYHIGTVCWLLGVAFLTLSGFQWIEFITNRRAARMYPDFEDVVRF
ncbi:MAG TPA: hypothetical protein VGI19_02700 [Candidatus Cybelea sp.]|jgi:hypothetical protein